LVTSHLEHAKLRNATKSTRLNRNFKALGGSVR
jgi:hypothetical protein